LRPPAPRCELMIWLAVVVTLFLFAYLLAALLRPEWF
jgi:K+-transporting ATPase KdpF subunit